MTKGSACVVFFAAALMFLTNFCVDVYTPSIRQICSDLSASEFYASLTFSANLFFIALSGLVYGPVSDYIGRRKTILTGISIFVLGSFLLTFAKDINSIIACRIIQGIGGGTTISLAVAIVCDSFKGAERIKAFSIIGIVESTTPIIAPMIGIMILKMFSWHDIFKLMLILGSILLILLYKFLPETLPAKNRKRNISSRRSLREYGKLMLNEYYMRYIMIKNIVIAFMWMDFTHMPLIVIGMGYDVSRFTLYAIGCTTFSVAGLFIAYKSANKLKAVTLTKIGIYMLLSSSLISVILYFVLPELALLAKVTMYTGIVLMVGPASAHGMSFVPKSQNGTGASFSTSSELFLSVPPICLVNYFYKHHPGSYVRHHMGTHYMRPYFISHKRESR